MQASRGIESADTSTSAPAAPGAEDYSRIFVSLPEAYLLLDPDHRIVSANKAYLTATMQTLDAIVGKNLFDIFPDDPNDPNADGVARLRESLALVAGTRAAHRMARQRYRIRKPDGEFVERWWDPVNAPVLDDRGKITLLIHRALDVTEQVQAERQTQQWSHIVEQSGDFMGLASLDGMSTYLNEAGCKLVGLDQAQARGTHMADYFFSEHRTFFREQILPMVQSLGHWEGESRFRHFKSGAAIPVFMTLFAIRNAAGKIVAYGTVTRDLTAENAQKTALAASENSFRAMADSMPQIVWSTLPDGFADYYNARWYEFTGLPDGSMGSGLSAGVFYPDDLAQTYERWTHALKTGDPYEAEYRLRHRSGVYRWVLARALPVRDSQGHITRWFGTCTDIHDTKIAADIARNVELRLTLALEAGKIGVWDYDVSNDVLTWDARVREVSGVAADEPVTFAGTFVSVVHPDDRDNVLDMLRHAIEDGTDIDTEFRLVPRDGGAPRWATINGRRIIGDDGSISICGTALDIDVLKRMADQRGLVAHELSHRIKNIFSVIAGLIGLSARTFPQSRDFADQLRARIMALSRAHDFVRPQSDDPAVDRVESSLHGMLAELFVPYALDGASRTRISGQDIQIDDRAATPFALVFHELATNAAKYGALAAPEGRVTLTSHINEDSYMLVWKETGGEKDEDGQRDLEADIGFGSTLIKLAVEAQLGGSFTRHWDPDGLRVEVSIPLASLRRSEN